LYLISITELNLEKSDSSDSEDSGDAENVDVKKNKYERTRLAHVLEWDKQFWKLTKPRFGVHQLLLCKECQEFNYKMGKSRFELNGERVHVTQSLCDECVLLNIDMSNTELRHADPNYPDNTYKDSNKDK
jgi:hypothetical protein